MSEETKDIQNRFTAYLNRAIRNRKLNYIEQRSRHILSFSEDIDENEKEHLDFEEQFHSYLSEKTAFIFTDWNQIQRFMEYVENERLVKAISHLKERERKLLFMRIFGELSLAEIGEVFHIKSKQVEMAYYYILRKLRKEMGVKGDEF